MKKKECPSCAMEINAENKICPICTYEFPQKNPLYQWIAILLAVVFLLMMFF